VRLRKKCPSAFGPSLARQRMSGIDFFLVADRWEGEIVNEAHVILLKRI
jgi:hypothetical protein